MSLNTLISLTAFGVAGYLLLKAHQSGALDNLFAPPAGGAAPPAGGAGGCDCSQYSGGGGAPASPPSPPPAAGNGNGNGGAEEEDSDGGSKDKKSSKKKSNYSVSFMGQRVRPVRSAAGILSTIDPLSGEEYYFKSFAASASRCKSEFNGSCGTECSKGSASECRDCQDACGGGGGSSGGTISAPVQQAGATRDSRRCSSEFNGSCGTECKSPNSSACVTCRAVCEGNFPPVVAPAHGDGGGGGAEEDESGPGKPSPGSTGGGGTTGGGDQTATDPCIAECAGSAAPAPAPSNGGGAPPPAAGGALGCGYTVRQMDSDTTRWRTDDAQGNEVSGGKTYLGSKAEQEAWSRQHCQSQGGGAKSAAIFIHASNGRDGRGTDRLRRSRFARFYGEGRLSAGNRIGDLSESIYEQYVPGQQTAQSNVSYPWERTGTERQVGPYAMRAGITPNRMAFPTKVFRSQRAKVTGLPRKAYYVSDVAYSNSTELEGSNLNRISMAAGPTYGDYRYIARPQTASGNPVAATVSFR